MRNKKLNTFNPNLDILRVMAMISVVIIHTTDAIVLNPSMVSSELWWLSNIMEGIIRFAVPTFFLITGALLLRNNRESAETFYKKRFLRMLGVYISWSIIYGLFSSYVNETNIDIYSIWTGILTFKGYYHMWFFEHLLVVYLFIPIIRKMINRLDDIYLYIITTIFMIIGIKLNYLALKNGMLDIMPITKTFGYIGYVILGYLLSNVIKNHKKICKWIGIAMCLGGMTFTILSVYNSLNPETGTIWTKYYDPLSWTAFSSSVGMFLFFNSLEIKSKSNSVFRYLSKISFGVFLIHPALVTESIKMGYYIPELNSISSYINITLIIILLSLILSAILSKCPILKKLI